MNIAIIQARMGSTRFPGKMLHKIEGIPMIELVLKQLKVSKKADIIALASTTSKENEPLIEHVNKLGFKTFAGSEDDVLDRFYQAAKSFDASDDDTIIRVTGDCPLIDPDIVDKVIDAFNNNDCDFCCNTQPPTFPDGLDVEVFSFRTLTKAWEEAKLQSEREHVTPYMWKNKDKFKLFNVENDIDYSKLRVTVDEKEDMELVKKVMKNFDEETIHLKDIVTILKNHPDIMEINKMYERNEGFQKSINEDELNVKNGQDMWKKAKKMIPGGSQLLSKRSEMFLPSYWPSYYKSAKGIRMIDLDGNELIDFTIMGVGSCILGYADDDVNEAVTKVITDGSMATLNSPEEVGLAEKLLEIHDWADQVRYSRCGGEGMAVAVRIGRAASKKSKVAFCGYHGWHDWYLSCNLSDDKNLDGHLLPGLEPNGIPRELINTSIPFEYNNIEQLKKIVQDNDIGVIVLEPYRHQKPEDNFIQKVKDIATEIGAVLIFDEITCGWRNNVGGMHLEYGIIPDMVVYAKAMSNGYPMAAIIGNKKTMEASQDTFISSTYWTERIGPTAALATIKKFEEKDVPGHINKIGALIESGWKKAAEETGLDISTVGPNSLITFSFNYDKKPELKTLFTQEMLKRGYLAGLSVYVSYAHKEEDVEKYIENVTEVFKLIKDNVENPEKLLLGEVCHSDFKRLT